MSDCEVNEKKQYEDVVCNGDTLASVWRFQRNLTIKDEGRRFTEGAVHTESMKKAMDDSFIH